MHMFFSVSLTVLLSLTLLGPVQAETLSTDAAASATGQQVQKLLAGVRLYFIPNQGQADARVKYYLPGHDTQVYFTATGLTLRLHTAEHETPRREASLTALPQQADADQPWVVKLDFVGARSDLQLDGGERSDAVVSYFKGSPEQWQTGLPTYQKVVYREVWPGIDVEYRGTGQQLKATFIVKPGADPKQIRLAYRGVTKLALTKTGQLNVHTPAQVLTEDTPYSYQERNGKRVEVRSAYRLRRHVSRTTHAFHYGFQVGKYDRRQSLIIDPVIVVYAGYIGGSGGDEGSGIAVDSAGNAYVTGYTGSAQTTFPETVGPDLSYNGNSDAFVAKVRADGAGLVYAGYIGGSGGEYGFDIAVDSAGNAYVTGDTDSTQTAFPVKGGPDLSYNGNGDAFVAKVRADGTALVYAGYIGGSGGDGGRGIAVDSAGNAYVAGPTGSAQTTFPVKVGPDLSYNGNGDAFVAKVRADGTALVYAGYIGGSGGDIAHGIAVDSAGNAYVMGRTVSNQATFPETVGPDLTFNGGEDAFVAKVRADGTALVYAGYIGGSDIDQGIGIAVDSAGNAYVTGGTHSAQTTFPVKVGPDLSYNGDNDAYGDAFVAKVRADGTALVYAGYIGGSKGDYGTGIAVDSAGNAYVTGGTLSDQTTFPVKGGPDLTYNGNGLDDAFVAKVRADGTALVYAGYIGGNDNDDGTGIAVDSAGNAYVMGYTFSDQTTFPVKVGPDLSFNSPGSIDAFVAKVGGLPLAGIGVFRTTAPNIGRWYLDANRSGLLNLCTIDKCLGPFGASTDVPVVGRWNGVGNVRLGIYRPGTRAWYLDLNGDGVLNGIPTDRAMVFGIAGDLPVVGDWTGTGVSRVGVFRPSTGIWYLDKNNNGILEACTIDLCQGPFGSSGNRPVVGDWSGNGKSKIGVYRASVNQWVIDYNGDGKWNGTLTDKLWTFGLATDQQVVGDWTGDGKSKVGVFRPSTGMWYLDANGNGGWNVGDLLRGPFGLATDKAVAGAW